MHIFIDFLEYFFESIFLLFCDQLVDAVGENHCLQSVSELNRLVGTPKFYMFLRDESNFDLISVVKFEVIHLLFNASLAVIRTLGLF